MTQPKRLLLALCALVLTLCGCGHKSGGETLSLVIRPGNHPAEVLYLYTYGTNSVAKDTILAGETTRLEYVRDSVDLFLLTDSLDRIILPLIPDSVDLSVTLAPKFKLKGATHTPRLEEWYRLTQERDTLSTELLDLLEEEGDRPIGLLETLGAIDRFGKTPELMNRYNRSALNQRTYLELLGREGYGEISYSYSFPHYLAVKDRKGKARTLGEVIRKDSLLVACLLDGTRLSEGDTTFLHALDSLSKVNYFVLPLADSIPPYWQKALPSHGRTYTVVDSLGAATEEAHRLRVEWLPTYMVVDSLGQIKHRGHDADSLLFFLKASRTP